jgi:cobalt-precorrin-5B (C1)-methyltransferase
MAKRLRSGFTTGSCAAAAAKAAATFLVDQVRLQDVEIPFPDGSRNNFTVHRLISWNTSVTASVIKDAGDDPDVTNRAEIMATVSLGHNSEDTEDCILLDNLLLCRGEGVGVVTKPGLAIPAGEPAINPVPRKMISQAVQEVVGKQPVTVTISVPMGKILAEKTLNKRLGIIGGLSILGTTGIVRPISADAWTATIKASLDVAKQAGLTEVVLSTGRTSEKGAQQLLDLPEEAYAMMGDYLEFSLLECGKRGFKTIHLAGMWAKIMKAALCIPQTHVRNGALETTDGARFLKELGASGKLLQAIEQSNTAREMLEHLVTHQRNDIIEAVCLKAKEYCHQVSKTEIKVYLVNHKAETTTHV